MRERQQFEDLRVVVKHLLEMRHMPFGVGRIAREAAAEMIVDAAGAQRVEEFAHRVAKTRIAAAERLVLQRKRKIGAFGNFGARPMPPLTGSRMRSSASEARVRSSGAERAAGARRGEFAQMRRRARALFEQRARFVRQARRRRRAPGGTKGGPSAAPGANRCRRRTARPRASGTSSAASRPVRPSHAARSCSDGRCRAAPRDRLSRRRNRAFISFAVSGSSKDSCAITWHQWHAA